MATFADRCPEYEKLYHKLLIFRDDSYVRQIETLVSRGEKMMDQMSILQSFRESEYWVPENFEQSRKTRFEVIKLCSQLTNCESMLQKTLSIDSVIPPLSNDLMDAISRKNTEISKLHQRCSRCSSALTDKLMRIKNAGS